MLAIGRALLFNPRVLVMDEPTEGLAPVIVEQVTATLKQLAHTTSEATGCGVADRKEHRRRGRFGRPSGINGQRAHRRELSARELRPIEAQQRCWCAFARRSEAEASVVIKMRRRRGANRSARHVEAIPALLRRHCKQLTRWNAIQPECRCTMAVRTSLAEARRGVSECHRAFRKRTQRARVRIPVASTLQRAAYAQHFSTRRELAVLPQAGNRQAGLPRCGRSSTRAPLNGKCSSAEVALHHPDAKRRIPGDRGSSVSNMASVRLFARPRDLGGSVGSRFGRTALATRQCARFLWECEGMVSPSLSLCASVRRAERYCDVFVTCVSNPPHQRRVLANSAHAWPA